ncbi:Uncharacterized membrane protein [Anaerocolumna jejuensis DSM 15929]|uniref:Uncharacterized membrane protein n=1 Tax=Anaerocolumna jejuensis DSM 15929 TaxID=1121322 RepID=A0A1M6K6W9_9FIRM|nr:SdpI family protein [Anaerocolumna jejuensis]SHJ54729.1 Uncharacterized membrane protein [Anaerocolumna jejuensis DSM 15929]
MNKFKKLYYCLMFLPLVITLISLIFLPDLIPAHFSGDKADRYGSKYETLLLPVLTILFGYFLLTMGKESSKKETQRNNNNEQISVITGLCTLLVFNILCLYFLYVDFHKITNLTQVPVDLFSLLFTVLGITFIIIGNYMPKLKLNSIIGLRTSWSMKNETTWKKSQKFGGASFIILGILMVIGNVFFFHNMESFLITMVLLGIDLIVSVVYTYFMAKKYSN